MYGAGDYRNGLGCSALRTFAGLLEFVRRGRRCDTGQRSEINRVAALTETGT